MTTSQKNLYRLNNFSAATLLGIPVEEPERLFNNNLSDLKAEYHYLVHQWHPDLNKTDLNTSDVLQHIIKLYECAKERIENNTWRLPGILNINDISGKKYTLNYRKKIPFEFGEFYISRCFVTYIVRSEFKGYYDRAVKIIRSLTFADDKMHKEFNRSLPQIVKTLTTKDGYVLVLQKDPEMVRLRDVLDHSGGVIDARHVAWILSTLHNLSCYLSTAKVIHNDISPDNYFIGPRGHTGALLGGWWYALPQGSVTHELPERTYDTTPEDILRIGRADMRVDLTLIRLTGRELLGDPKALYLHRKKEIPQPLAMWLRMPTAGNPFDDYTIWDTKILPQSFGPRRYIELPLSFSDIYPQKGVDHTTSSCTSKGSPMAHPA